MYYLSFVDMLDGKADLCEPIQDLRLGKDLIFIFFLFDFLSKITSIGITHNNMK